MEEARRSGLVDLLLSIVRMARDILRMIMSSKIRRIHDMQTNDHTAVNTDGHGGTYARTCPHRYHTYYTHTHTHTHTHIQTHTCTEV